ncbi:hypothetical protein, unlikely [Trypanosoma brucei gambiense DAL972]|uniref:Uncharacterized protein n=1 Tax=Trypanosoma brucei gambiense (strain MHOM/CI/86/DAL972) TaxID=679716 RepID=C9ZVX4_TRYB9|nr:hypothetical protein, unlikely [Trypanosoma brucei gambiense DAL972]CBH13562.1 hypothetical protein, unlikely [Trypanosoma brucei gambiense DAL972]|eukprot:XP_011775839.1 hypothetical protein, unlikely [Trypanosoma brucei gambiense DAL972]
MCFQFSFFFSFFHCERRRGSERLTARHFSTVSIIQTLMCGSYSFALHHWDSFNLFLPPFKVFLLCFRLLFDNSYYFYYSTPSSQRVHGRWRRRSLVTRLTA